MADSSISFEMGSNVATGLGYIGMDAIRRNLIRYADNLNHAWIPEAIQAAAEVFKAALEAATPIGSKSYKDYKGKSHTPGTAKRNVIIYKRKSPRGVLTISNVDMALLVGYAKKQAFYMYWYEEGRENQTRRPFVKAVYDGAYQEAMNAAVAVLKQRIA